jgi:dCMP deaminase
MKEKFIKYFMDVAQRTSQLSYAVRLKVGAIIVKDDRIISIGYNGMPSGWDNNCEHIEYMSRDSGSWIDPEEVNVQWPFTEEDLDPDLGYARRYRLVTKPEVLHAETNAIAKLAKSNESGVGATLFITHAPCLDCAKLIYQSGINNVLYRNTYRSDDGITFLNKSGVNVTKHTVQN